MLRQNYNTYNNNAGGYYQGNQQYPQNNYYGPSYGPSYGSSNYGYSNYNNQYGYNNNYMNDRMYYEDRVFDEQERLNYERPTYRRSKMLANPDFGNFNFKKGYTAEVWLNDGETVILSAHSRKKTYRTHYSPELLRTFFFGWLGKLLRYFYLDRLFGLHIDTVKTVKTKNYIFVTAHVLPT